MQLGFTYYRDSNNALQNFIAKLRFKRDVIEVTQKHKVDGFTLVKSLGAWQGKTEPSFQMYLEGVSKSKAKQLASEFRDKFGQDAVMLKDSERVEFV